MVILIEVMKSLPRNAFSVNGGFPRGRKTICFVRQSGEA